MNTADKNLPLRHQSLHTLEQHNGFIERHIGSDNKEVGKMLSSLGVSSLEQLISETIPADIRSQQPLDLPPACSEEEALRTLAAMAKLNVLKKSFIGMGYYGTITPKVILRNVFENPGWYTAYTPYQAEIAQGRLEALLNFQQTIIDLTGMEIANASLLDEATAAAEAMAMARRTSRTKSNKFFVHSQCFAQTIDVVKTRAHFFGFELIFGDASEAANHDVFGALLQYPDQSGNITDLSDIIARLRTTGAVVAVASDLLALVLLKSPGAMGADIVLGSAQRFGVPMGFGGPHAAFFATREANVRAMPGRVIGVSKDKHGNPAMRMALQTREQHIRREKANSNICTSQVLLANIAGFYAVYHGQRGLRVIAERVNRFSHIIAEALRDAGFNLPHKHFFDTVHVDCGSNTGNIYQAAQGVDINLRRVNMHTLGISLDETTTREDISKLLASFGVSQFDLAELDSRANHSIPSVLLREDAVLSHPVFNTHHSEHEMLRYLKRLQNKDLALDHSMISLGSCTMKLNATSEMLPVSWAEFSQPHPFSPADQNTGYYAMIDSLANYLKAITGFAEVCMQPNSGAQGEYAGLVAIARYHASRGESHRNICLIPRSAHGTNPATAQMCGMKVVVVNCDERGNVELEDLRRLSAEHAPNLACLMITYPSTHGVFEKDIRAICACIHEHGGQVYMDGANLNAQVGLSSPALIGADVSHMNLHKTFCIPHGGGGPGMGPIGLAKHLAPFVPNHAVAPITGEHTGQGAIAAAPFGSASILPISWMYITMMGREGLKRATEIAILNANYIAHRLGKYYPVLYTGWQGRVAHECIIDIRDIKTKTGVSEVDIAKRLMDYGFHAPTMSFPVAGTMMIEPTESEALPELERFITAMIAIRGEIDAIAKGQLPADDNMLKNAPHTQNELVGEWLHPYSREQAVFPLAWVAHNKFWPSVKRVDDVHGDKNLFCACVAMEDYVE